MFEYDVTNKIQTEETMILQGSMLSYSLKMLIKQLLYVFLLQIFPIGLLLNKQISLTEE
jgi:hypothetical protein